MKKTNNPRALTLIKLIHTAIWFILVVAILFVLYAGLFDQVNVLVWICIGLVLIETIVLLIFKWNCPLTILGRSYTNNPSLGFDIFLPVWLAKYNKMIFSVLFLIGLALVIWRVAF